VASIRGRLDKLEQESEEFYETLVLPNGTEITYEAGELFDVLCAVLDGREHRLLPYLRAVDTNQGMPGLIRAIESSKARRDGERDGA